MNGANIQSPRAILFDWDNTLVDVWPAIHDAINTTFAAMGHESWTLEETKARVRKSLRDSFPEMFGDRWTEARQIFYDRYAKIHLQYLTPLPAAGEVLAWLASKEIYLAVVSNKTGSYLRAEAEKIGWNNYFGRIIGATDAEEDKPAQAPVHMALDGSGIDAGADVWFVGDGAIDVQCAINSGMTPLILMYDGTEQELARHNLVQFVGSKCRLRGMGGLKKVVEDRIFPISEK
ncbi:MAG: HAD family hydrolase [Alphaproteobacteria bacterium]|nr:HAD family hydrolase [Alphaproteobacteria bacterium]